MNATALDYLPIARQLADLLGPLVSAGDHTPAALVAAYVNFELRRPGWCQGHASQTTEEVYYCDPASGLHGWMCSTCRKTTQTG